MFARQNAAGRATRARVDREWDIIDELITDARVYTKVGYTYILDTSERGY